MCQRQFLLYEQATTQAHLFDYGCSVYCFQLFLTLTTDNSYSNNNVTRASCVGRGLTVSTVTAHVFDECLTNDSRFVTS